MSDVLDDFFKDKSAMEYTMNLGYNANNQKGGWAPGSGVINASNKCMCEVSVCDDCLLGRIGYAQAYIVPQRFINLLDPQSALVNGTVFADLVMSYCKPAKGSVLSREV